jgi:hypothetical protein
MIKVSMSNRPPEEPINIIKVKVTVLEDKFDRSLKNILKMYILREGEYHVEEK